MSIRQRLKSAEKKVGMGDEPLMIFFRTFYEKKDGSEPDSVSYCVNIHGSVHDYVSAKKGETRQDFEARVRQRCFEDAGQ